MTQNFCPAKWILPALLLGISILNAQEPTPGHSERSIRFPDIPGYRTLKCDLHIHTVFSDGSVWPNIRVAEALKDGLDAISITDHIEYQPHLEDIPHPDRNRGYELARETAEGSGLVVINGVEITRDMPPGHFNAIFIEDANRLNQDDVMKVLREARNQDAFVFWNHPHWRAQHRDGIAVLNEIHYELLSEGLISGIEIYNEFTYSDEALQIGLDHGLTLLGSSDVHGLVDWQFKVPEGGHRPVTLVFANEKSSAGVKEALESGRTAVWFDNTLVGDAEYLVPLIQHSLVVERKGDSRVETLMIENRSDATFLLENLSGYTFHDQASVFMLKAHQKTRIQVKTVEKTDTFQLRFVVLNAITAPGKHPEIEIVVD